MFDVHWTLYLFDTLSLEETVFVDKLIAVCPANFARVFLNPWKPDNLRGTSNGVGIGESR